jgi:FkbM family methyltransferase
MESQANLMKHFIRDIIKGMTYFIPLAWIEKILIWKMGYPIISYGPDGEDVILRNMFRGTENGFYVDVGAYHPTRFSNTRQLYRSGWSGINIDAMPKSMSIFKKERPRDINLEIGISEKPQTLTYHMFKEQAYNTFSKTLATEYARTGHVQRATVSINTLPLATVLDTHVPPSQKIDLLSIDVEGYDMTVLRSNNWHIYRPRVIAIEDIGFNSEDPHTSEIFTFLKDKGYRLEVATPKTLFFRIHT